MEGGGLVKPIVSRNRAARNAGGSFSGKAPARCVALLGVLVLPATCGSLAAQGHDRGGEYAEADIAYGAQLYAGECSSCHGPNGDLVPGVDLRSGRFRNASTDQQLRTLITTGIPDAGMPSFNFDDAELAGVVAYLRNMASFAARDVDVGDTGRGRALFEGKGGCTGCHRVDGHGAGLAPDLGNVGALRTASALQASILDPNSAMLPINRPVHAVTQDGQVFNGRRLNEDTFTIQMMDEQGRLVSLAKENLSEFTIHLESPMPAYQDKLTSGEVADLVAYLLSLKGS